MTAQAMSAETATRNKTEPGMPALLSGQICLDQMRKENADAAQGDKRNHKLRHDARLDNMQKLPRNCEALVRQLELPHFLHPSQAIVAIKIFNERPHDRTPLLVASER